MKYILKIEDSVYTLIKSNYLIFPSQGVVTRTAQHKPLTEYIMAIVFDWLVNMLETMFTFLLSWRNKWPPHWPIIVVVKQHGFYNRSYKLWWHHFNLLVYIPVSDGLIYQGIERCKSENIDFGRCIYFSFDLKKINIGYTCITH